MLPYICSRTPRHQTGPYPALRVGGQWSNCGEWFEEIQAAVQQLELSSQGNEEANQDPKTHILKLLQRISTQFFLTFLTELILNSANGWVPYVGHVTSCYGPIIVHNSTTTESTISTATQGTPKSGGTADIDWGVYSCYAITVILGWLAFSQAYKFKKCKVKSTEYVV